MGDNIYMHDEMPNSYDSELNIKNIFMIFWSEKWLIILLTMSIAIVTVVYAINTPNIYKSTALLYPNEDSGMSSSLSSASAQFSGLAAMAGITASMGGGQDKTEVALSKLRSLQFFSDYIYDDILIELMASEKWDNSSKKLIIDKSIFDEKQNKWLRKASNTRKVKPSPQEAFIEYNKIVKIVKDRLSGFVTISVEHFSPVFSKNLVDKLVYNVNNSIKENDINEGKESIKYLMKQQESTSLLSLDGVFSSLIEDQIKKNMLADVSSEYVYRIIDPAVIPELKIRPSRALMCITGSILGGFFSLLIVLMKFYLREKKLLTKIKNLIK